MTLGSLPNLGPTIVRQLEAVGIHDRATLEAVGPAHAYLRLSAAADKRLPLCYYLYSLEAALQSRDWRTLTNEEKQRLRRDIET